jgi:type I restriction enzyme R subunit
LARLQRGQRQPSRLKRRRHPRISPNNGFGFTDYLL